MDTNNVYEVIKGTMTTIAKKVDDELPEGFGFCVLVFPFGKTEDGQMMYISNADRLDIVKAMEEWIEKTKDIFGNDTGKY